MTGDLLALSDGLQTCGCTHVAMESMGDEGEPVFNRLEGTCEVVLVNAPHVKAVSGGKRGVNDTARLAERLSYGLRRSRKHTHLLHKTERFSAV